MVIGFFRLVYSSTKVPALLANSRKFRVPIPILGIQAACPSSGAKCFTDQFLPSVVLLFLTHLRNWPLATNH